MAALRPGTAVRVRVPASSANLGPGFDSIGLALGVWDECVAEVLEAPGLIIEARGEGAEEVPRDERHLVHRAMVRAWERVGSQVPAGLRLTCTNAVPHGRGMGSSATAIVTGITAALALTDLAEGGNGTPDLDVVNDLASELEGHPDNASASVHGGLTISWSESPGRTSTAKPQLHPDIRVVVFVPQVQLSTATARAVLPQAVTLADAASNTARGALLTHALTAAPELLVPATRDWLHQEPRRASYPDSMALVDALRAAGHAATISGAGPSVLALTTRDAVASVIPFAGATWRALTPEVPTVGATVEIVADAR
ncbi:homoserine kinase [Janibacter sp. G1551]|uniref:homoserine kinase n=1 Tax=Janibacter sp. G1551 TaxID=3420440 RepID=UPI003CFFE020